MQQNTQALEVNARQAAADAEVEWLYALLESAPEAREILAGGFDVSQLQAEYDGTGALQASILASAFFRLRENLWLQNRSGALDSELWEPYRNLLTEFLGTEIARVQWDDNQGFFAADFEDEINRLFEERQRSTRP